VPEDIDVVESRITYTTKELLQRIDDRFERLEAMYASAPTRSEFTIVVNRLSALEEEQVKVRAVAVALKEDKSETFSRRDKLVGMLLAVIALSVQVFAVYGGGHP